MICCRCSREEFLDVNVTNFIPVFPLDLSYKWLCEECYEYYLEGIKQSVLESRSKKIMFIMGGSDLYHKESSYFLVKYVDPVPTEYDRSLQLIKTILKITTEDGYVLGVGRASNIGWMLASILYSCRLCRPNKEFRVNFVLDPMLKEDVRKSFLDNLNKLENVNGILSEGGNNVDEILSGQ